MQRGVLSRNSSLWDALKAPAEVVCSASERFRQAVRSRPAREMANVSQRLSRFLKTFVPMVRITGNQGEIDQRFCRSTSSVSKYHPPQSANSPTAARRCRCPPLRTQPTKRVPSQCTAAALWRKQRQPGCRWRMSWTGLRQSKLHRTSWLRITRSSCC